MACLRAPCPGSHLALCAHQGHLRLPCDRGGLVTPTLAEIKFAFGERGQKVLGQDKSLRHSVSHGSSDSSGQSLRKCFVDAAREGVHPGQRGSRETGVFACGGSSDRPRSVVRSALS
ncbi:unnamed protein product [Rangifer tarandus platyrhynchus]|uniref:Uncharacterized protein n=2 Tax=Rangifer tarandus platyrhynchus TaxID=3082113 RepID=A0ABN8YRX9_RANTA|nr:unnamed protein product [Rangifer tarandus platyrhynchus]CAI9701677.1 unnamed protein product [Rangifer tarandus platyrhynchus]